MKGRICHLCGNPATGFASMWTAKEGERWYCHGDDDETPTCYERSGWPDGADATFGTPEEAMRALRFFIGEEKS